VAAQKIERSVGGDLRKPVRGLQLVFELLLPLQGFDESFLRQVLRVVDVAHHVVNLPENPSHIVRDETVLEFRRPCACFEQRPALPIVIPWRRIGLFHANLQR
jgi:hypothetical protein